MSMDAGWTFTMKYPASLLLSGLYSYLAVEMGTYPAHQGILINAQAAPQLYDRIGIVIGNLLHDIVGLGLTDREDVLDVLDVDLSSLLPFGAHVMLLRIAFVATLYLNNTAFTKKAWI